MKKHHTKLINLKFTGPMESKNQAIKTMKKLGFVDTSDSIPWREAFPELNEDNEPGQMLSAARHKKELTQVQLSNLTGIPRRHISEMENNKRPIGKMNAKKFEKALNIGYKVFL